MSEPLVSVVIPSYNHERFLPQAIESVFNQTYSNIELIVVDDGSRDRSPELIRAYRHRSPVPFRAHLRTNHGAAASINFGVAQSRGPYVTILNSDDYFAAERIEALVEAALRTGAECLFTHIDTFGANGEVFGDDHWSRGWYIEGLERARTLPTVGLACLTFSYQVSSGNLFFTRALFDRTVGFRNYRVTHDLDMVMQMLCITEPLVVPEKLLYYRMHEDNESHKTRHLHEVEGMQILRDFFGATALGSENPRAPHPRNWPGYFDEFCERYSPWFSREPYSALRAALLL